MDHMLEQTVDTSSQSEQESNPTITIHGNEDDIDDNEHEISLESGSGDSRSRVTMDDSALNASVNQVSITSSHQSVFDSPSLPLQYQLKSENGQVTYRVVQITDIQNNEQTTPAQVVGGTGVAQAIITHATNPFASVTTSAASSGSEGPFYVMMAPTQEIISPGTTVGSSSLASRRKAISAEGTRVSRDEKRRATHNEVERRRRDKINNWITKLAKIVPDCSQDHTKQGQSKGGILAKACEYIHGLVDENRKLAEIVKENENLSNELDSARQQLLDTKTELRRLRHVLQRHGISIEETT